MDPARWLDTAEGRFWIAYQRGSQLLERAVDQQLRATANLSHAEFEILSRLTAAPARRLRMGALAQLLIAPKSRLNYQIGQLVDAGLVERLPDPDDRRGLYAVMTDAGLERFTAAVPGLIDFVQVYVTAHLGPGEQAQLTAVMERIAGAVSPPAERRQAETDPTTVSATGPGSAPGLAEMDC